MYFNIFGGTCCQGNIMTRLSSISKWSRHTFKDTTVILDTHTHVILNNIIDQLKKKMCVNV